VACIIVGFLAVAVEVPQFPRISRFLLFAGLTDFSDFGRYYGQNKAIVGVFNGSVVYFNVGVGLT
jgi:hypothetical protein